MSGHNHLAVLAADIQEAHRGVTLHAEFAAQRALAAGRMLIEAKAALPHGKWAEWLSQEVKISGRTARRYMQLTRSGVELATVAEIGIRGAATRFAKSRVPRPALGQYAHATFNGGTLALVYRCSIQQDRFHVVVIGHIDGSDHAVVATRHPVPDELLSVCLAEAGFPVGAASFKFGASVGRIPEVFRALAFDDQEMASLLSPELNAEAVARGISFSDAACITKHDLSLEDGQRCLQLAAVPKDMFEEACDAARSSGVPVDVRGLLGRAGIASA